MKRFYSFLSVLIIPSTLFLYAWFPTGSPGGKTGSVGDEGATCISCHPGNPVQAQEGMITSDIPADGYIPGEKYMITATVTHPDITKAGFELTVENEDGDKLGGLAVSDSDRTKFTNGENALTHTEAGNAPDGNTNSWSMEWTAPETGSGPVKFYAAFNASVSKVYTIYTSNMMTSEQFASIGDDILASKVNVFPNPATNNVNINLPAGSEVRVISMLGKQVLSIEQSGQLEKFDVSRFDNGMYFIQVLHEGNTATMRFLKN